MILRCGNGPLQRPIAIGGWVASDQGSPVTFLNHFNMCT
jgi:hypothetical protein